MHLIRLAVHRVQCTATSGGMFFRRDPRFCLWRDLASFRKWPCKSTFVANTQKVRHFEVQVMSMGCAPDLVARDVNHWLPD
jgi:hypothetical protein